MTPGRGLFGPTVDRLDHDFDHALEVVRNNGTLARVFQAASALGDFSLIWHLIGVARGTTSDRRAMQAVALSALLGAESLIINQGVKRLFKRERPTVSGDERFEVRTPSTSSFPSGHASSAVFAAVILSGWGGRRWNSRSMREWRPASLFRNRSGGVLRQAQTGRLSLFSAVD